MYVKKKYMKILGGSDLYRKVFLNIKNCYIKKFVLFVGINLEQKQVREIEVYVKR